ncbi:cadherin-13 [Alosa sapidissima]|uniref:cadherin-13 n=1 Tax=Alosa sapidissima TaxID=34773 RepID=UPI001C07F5F1|nr:cadherin-13 [Alosa sapidissima]
MEMGFHILLAFLASQAVGIGAEQAGNGECVPGFQEKKYQVEYNGGFQKDQPLLQVLFDDCAGNEDVAFEVSNPDFLIDENLNLVAQGDVVSSGAVLFIHGLSPHADDMAQVDVVGAPAWSLHTTKEIVAVDQEPASRLRRSLLAPPMYVIENQRSPIPRTIGKSHIIPNELRADHTFRLTGMGADEDPVGVFSINRYTGEVSVSRSLDREVIPIYRLQVSTVDMSGYLVEGPVALEISVIDQNDNRPIFTELRYSGEVLEGSPTGTTVMTMTAVDADDPNTDNAVLRYNIMRQSPDKPSPNMFYIDPERGHIVTVISPSLLDREFQAIVDEGSTGVVVNLTVDDRDDPATGAWRAVYSIINGDPNQSFEITTNPDNNEGMLSVIKPLDYERTAYHTLLIKVENEEQLVPDVGYGPSSTATVTVTVQDVNEGPIFYPDPMVVTKEENISVGSFVALLNATDPDNLQNQNVRYAVLRDPAGWLNVHPERGAVNTTAVLDRESPFVHNNQYTAVFMAYDNGHPPATGTGTLVITLQDVNDNAPYVYPSVVRVCEDAKELNVFTLAGRDRDISPNGEPFKIELAKQNGLDKTWRATRINWF